MSVPRNPDRRRNVGRGEPEPERTPMSSLHSHPDSERLEARAAGELAPEEARALDAHLEVCGRCRAEVEGWTLLLAELDALPQQAPRADFAARVMAQVDVERVRQGAIRPSLATRLVEGLGDPVFGALRRLRRHRRAEAGSPAPAGAPAHGAHAGSAGSIRHLTPAGIQDYLEGALAARIRTRVDAHLALCPDCSGEVESWSLLFRDIEALPELSPSAGFADRVMDRVQVQAVAAVTARQQVPLTTRVGQRVARGFERIRPRTRRGWFMAGSLAAAPSLGVVAVVASILLSPLLSFPDLLIFFRWRAFDAVGSLGGRVLATLTETPVLYATWEALSGLSQASPFALLAAFAFATALVATATFVVYRNLIAPSLMGETHAQPTS
jgi:anti-sigma factor RsiW